MFEQYKGIFNDVIKLSRRRRIYYEKVAPQSGNLVDFIEFNKTDEGNQLKQYEKYLEDYFEGLSFDIVKIIQIIMYLGRDNLYSDLCPEERYKREEKYLDENGWKDKSIEINTITKKIPLDKYLMDGFKMLEVNLI